MENDNLKYKVTRFARNNNPIFSQRDKRNGMLNYSKYFGKLFGSSGVFFLT